MLDRQNKKVPAEEVPEETEDKAKAKKVAEEEAARHSHSKVDKAFDKIYDKYLKPESDGAKKLIRSDALLNERTAKKYR